MATKTGGRVWIQGAVSYEGDATHGVVHVHPYDAPTAAPLATYSFGLRGNVHLDGYGAAGRLASHVAGIRYRETSITLTAVRAALVDVAASCLLSAAAIDDLRETGEAQS